MGVTVEVRVCLRVGVGVEVWTQRRSVYPEREAHKPSPNQARAELYTT